MEIIDDLTRNIIQAAQEISSLKNERRQLMNDLESLRHQVRRHDAIVRENEKLRKDQDQLRTRLVRLQKKIDKHLLIETTLAHHSGGDNYEERA